ncbi:MAG: SGNH/GDSL hydrolase family protein [Lentisphaerae bacterium]|nr:SGNH/GDSL hydrolase family protein [Lentisphaerota bacterium]
MKNQVIVFQGDSITDVGRSREVEQERRPNSQLGAGYPALVAARLLRDRCRDSLQFHNRGISGNRVVDLYARWRRDTLNFRPDIISILIGVNDTWHDSIPGNPNGVEVPRYARVYRELLSWTREVLPEVKLVLMEPFVLPFGAVQEHWLPEMDARRQVVAGLAQEFAAQFVPCQQVLNQACQEMPQEYWLADGVHPTLPGHQLLADAWLKHCQELF